MKNIFKKTLCAAALAFTAMAVAYYCSSADKAGASESEAATETEQAAPESVSAADGVIIVTDDTQFRPGMKPEVATVIDFNATWCGPCKMLAPAFDKAAGEFAGKVKFYSVDIDKNPQTAQAFGVTAIPTLVFVSTDGNATTYVGTDAFANDSTIEKAASLEEAAQAIYPGLAQKVSELVK